MKKVAGVLFFYVVAALWMLNRDYLREPQKVSRIYRRVDRYYSLRGSDHNWRQLKTAPQGRASSHRG